MKNIVSLILFFLIYIHTFGQDSAIPLWGNQDAYLVNQTEKTFQLVDSLLSEYPPTIEKPLSSRKAALLLLDGVLHDTRLDGNKTLSKFIDYRINIVLEDLKQPINKGMKVYKLYNHSFIVKTRNATVAFDLYRGGVMQERSSLISDEIMKAIVEECDIMFLSHNHQDHIDTMVVKMFTDKEKQVIAPDNCMKENEKVTHIRSEQIIHKTFKVPGEKLRVKILPGHQSELINNIYVVTFQEGITVAHTGDQYSKEDLVWLSEVNENIPVLDVLLINCWTNSLTETIEGFDPKLVITGHENELGHSIDHREAYWLSYDKLEKVRQPNCLMTWGECLWYK